MKKLLVAILAVTLMASPAFAANGGGKKKAKRKAKIECTKDKTCDSKDCDPKSCDPKCCDYKACVKDEKCTSTSTCAGNK